MITFIREGRVEKDRGIFGGVGSSDSGGLNEGLRMMGRNVRVLRFAGLRFFEDLIGLKGLREFQSLVSYTDNSSHWPCEILFFAYGRKPLPQTTHNIHHYPYHCFQHRGWQR